MTPNEIRTHLRTRSFEPFRIFMSDGAVYDVRHPEMAYVSKFRIIVARDMADSEEGPLSRRAGTAGVHRPAARDAHRADER